MVLRPDPATFAILPWTLDGGAPEARMLCDIAMPDGTPFEGCPRSTLKRVIDDAEDVMRDVKTALEVEFYLFERDADGTADDAYGRRRFVLRLLAVRSRRRCAHRDGGSARSDGHRRLERAPRTRRRPARARSRRRRRARHGRSPGHRARRGQADRGPAQHPRDVHAQADRVVGRQRIARLRRVSATIDEVVRLHAIAGLARSRGRVSPRSAIRR